METIRRLRLITRFHKRREATDAHQRQSKHVRCNRNARINPEAYHYRDCNKRSAAGDYADYTGGEKYQNQDDERRGHHPAMITPAK